MIATVYVENNFFRVPVKDGISEEASAQMFMTEGGFDRTREESGRVVYYPPSRINKIEFDR